MMHNQQIPQIPHRLANGLGGGEEVRAVISISSFECWCFNVYNRYDTFGQTSTTNEQTDMRGYISNVMFASGRYEDSPKKIKM